MNDGDSKMRKIHVDFSKKLGRIKPMHAVNNGPAMMSSENVDDTNFELYKALGIPYARNHDASFYYRYGGDHTVDIPYIFRDFSADENDPASYDFTCTDDYIKNTEAAGTRTFYRLGSRIEHEMKKYGTIMPADFNKWARICEHIIMHYTEGWANGFYYDIEYWEIWNEADIDGDDATDKRCWSGTAKEFYELFRTTLDYLKTRFPHLKIGGPAAAGIKEKWVRGLLESLGDIKPDFFSWHIYTSEVNKLLERGRKAQELLDEYGLSECENILNEWNYVARGNCWSGAGETYSQRIRTGLGPKCSAFTSAVMLASQHSCIDMLMLYDARPSEWCTLFEPYVSTSPLKSYYSLKMFSELYRLGNEVCSETEGDDLYTVAAAADERCVMIAHYNDDERTEAKEIMLELSSIGAKNGVSVEFYALDDKHDMDLVRKERLVSDDVTLYFTMQNLSTYLIKIVNN